MKKFFSLISKKILILGVIGFLLVSIIPFLEISLLGKTKTIGIEKTYAITTAEFSALTPEEKNTRIATRVEAQSALDALTTSLKSTTGTAERAALTTQITAARESLTKAEEDAPRTNEEYAQNALEGTAEMKKKISEFAALFVSIFTPIIAFLAVIIGNLMGDEFIMGSNGSEGGTAIAELLYAIWLVFRDIMNYIFILILLIIAFMSIISPITQNDSFEIKKVLPRLVLAIVVINLTWFGARVVFDAVQISTQVIFGLPQSIIEFENHIEDNPCVVDVDKKRIDGVCNPIFTNLDFIKASGGEKVNVGGSDFTSFAFTSGAEIEGTAYNQSLEERLAAATSEGAIKTIEKEKNAIQNNKIVGGVDYGPVTIYWANFDPAKFNEGTIAPLFAFTLLQVQNLPQIAEKGLSEKGAGWSTLLINTIMALVLMIVIIALFIMMAINLFFRIIVLWVNIIFSPFMGLLMFKDQFSFLSGADNNEYIGLAAFIKHAFAPAIMGLPLVIGFILIVVARSKDIDISNSMSIEGPIVNGLSNIHQIFFYVLTIAVLWVGGVEAIKMTSTAVVQKMLEGVESTVVGAAKFIAKAPMYITFIPVADDGDDSTKDAISMNNLLDIPGAIEGGMRSKDQSNLDRVLDNNTPLKEYREKAPNTHNFMNKGKGNALKKELFTDLIDEKGASVKATDIKTILNNKKYKDAHTVMGNDNIDWKTFYLGEVARSGREVNQNDIAISKLNVQMPNGSAPQTNQNNNSSPNNTSQPTFQTKPIEYTKTFASNLSKTTHQTIIDEVIAESQNFGSNNTDRADFYKRLLDNTIVKGLNAKQINAIEEAKKKDQKNGKL